jgi:hypothetical protein
MNFDPDQLLADIKELILIPDIGDSLFHKVEELKGLKAKDIEYYQNMGLISKNAPPKSFEGQSFLITRKGKQWETSIDIPQQIVDYLVKSEIEPGLTKMDRGVKFPGLSGRYSITFEKKDSSHITGMIQVEKEERKEKPAAASPGSHLKVLQPVPKDKLKEFLFYLTNHKRLYEHVLSEFSLRWKPAIDFQLYNNNGEFSAEKSF